LHVDTTAASRVDPRAASAFSASATPRAWKFDALAQLHGRGLVTDSENQQTHERPLVARAFRRPHKADGQP